MVEIVKHTGDHAGNGMKEIVKKGAVFEKKVTEVIIDCKYTVPVRNIDQFKGHRGSTFHRILVATRGTETAVAAKRNELKIVTVWAAIHSTTKRRITTMDHFIDIFHLSISGMKSI